MKHMNLNFSSRVLNVFSKFNTSYDELKDCMIDLYRDELDEGVTKKEANEKIREISCDIFGVNKNSSRRERIRAYRDYGRDFFDVVEEVADIAITTGLKKNEWFNALTRYKNLAEGDTNIFTQESDEVILSVARMGKRHHDTMLQRLPKGKTYSLETDVYGAAVGGDIDRFITGQEDWLKLIEAIEKAYVYQVQDLIFTEMLAAPAKLPVTTGFVESGALNATNRKIFNTVLQNVSTANNNADVVIMGTMVGLQELENLIKVDWISNSQKDAVSSMGRLGNYGRYQLIEIPQRFKKNQVGVNYYNDNILWFFASGDNELIDMVDVGETIIDEVTERGESNANISDLMKYEVQREFGIATRIGRYFGQWTITT